VLCFTWNIGTVAVFLGLSVILVFMFGEWLDEQRDRNDDVGRFARLCWDDFTSGCARWFSGAVEWRDHFVALHPDRADFMFGLLREAFVAYADDVVSKRA